MTPEHIDEEEIVFNAVQDYLNENKILEKANIINRIKSYFTKASINISEAGILKHLESLVEKKRIAEGSKLTKDNALLHSKRKKIYNFILKNPGTYFNRIIKGVNLSNHVVYWHLSILKQFDLIKKTKIENRKIYYDSKLGIDAVKKLYFTTITEKSKKILDYLKEDDLGITQLGLASKLQMHPTTIKKYLSSLEKFGLIEKKKVSPKEILYFSKVD
jgi:predicted transcriptional regulator